MSAPETPEALYARLDARRTREGLRWWEVAAALDVSLQRVRLMAHGRCSTELRQRAEAWLQGGAGDA